MKIIIEGLTIHYEVYGDNTKQPLVLIGGWPMNLLSLNLINFDYAHILNELGKYFYVICPENPGFLRSDIPKDIWNIHDYGTYIHKFIKALNIQNPIVLGKSFGGGVALTYANMYPDDPIKSVIIVAGAIYNNDEYILYKFGIPLIRLLSKFMTWKFIPLVIKRFIIYGFLNVPKEKITKENASSYAIMTDVLNSYYLGDFEYKNIKPPIIFVWGDRDIIVPIWKAKKIHSESSSSKLIIIKGGHLAFEKRYKEVIKKIINLL